MKSLHLIALLSVLLLSQCSSPLPAPLWTGVVVSPEKQAQHAAATKDNPFVNSLGMKFVPVPGTNILMCTTETTVGQYQAAGLGYEAPGFPQGTHHCAVNISGVNAMAWCEWLSQKEGRKYRVPTDAEWSAAVGGSEYPWGTQWPPPNDCGNYLGQEVRVLEMKTYMQADGWGSKTIIEGFRDQHVFTAPVGSCPPNGLGIHDLGGNTWEWTAKGAGGVLRGGSWNNDLRGSLASSGGYYAPFSRGDDFGIRCVVVR